MSKVKNKTNTKKQNSTTPSNETNAPAEATKTLATTVEKTQTKQSILSWFDSIMVVLFSNSNLKVEF